MGILEWTCLSPCDKDQKNALTNLYVWTTKYSLKLIIISDKAGIIALSDTPIKRETLAMLHLQSWKSAYFSLIRHSLPAKSASIGFD
ncbi:MAG: hypothetical protein ACI808_002777 [Paraglaciecola sp.]|jgi:hypothetical protein